MSRKRRGNSPQGKSFSRFGQSPPSYNRDRSEARLADWPLMAQCRGIPVEQKRWFFSDNPVDTASALLICEDCSVREECREYAIEYEEFGTWGGMTADERWQKRLDDGWFQTRFPIPFMHGTAGGVVRHQQMHEPRCQWCSIGVKIRKEVIRAERAAQSGGAGVRPEQSSPLRGTARKGSRSA